MQQQTQKRIAMLDDIIEENEDFQELGQRRCTRELDMTELERCLLDTAAIDEEEYVALYERDTMEYFEEMAKEAQRLEERQRIQEEMDDEDWEEFEKGFDIPKRKRVSAWKPRKLPSAWYGHF